MFRSDENKTYKREIALYQGTSKEDAEFIAAAPDLVRDLMAEVTRLRKDAIKDKARVEELEAALVKSRRIMASRQPDKLSDGVYICDKALKGGAE